MISVFGSQVGPEELAQVAGCLDAQWMGAGPRVEAFEQAFAARLGLPNFAMLDSGSNSLYLAVRLLALPPGSEVILPSFTWVACAQAVLLCGCRPVFCDVDLQTQNVTAATIAPHLGPRTGAIMVVHYAGKPVDMAPILAFGRPVIEDAAHAVDSTWQGTACGAIGDIGIYSFDAVKNLASPEGGGITVRDPTLFERARSLRYCGIDRSGFASASRSPTHRWWEHRILDVAPKLLANDVSAAIAHAQLDKLDRLQQRRRQLWGRYQAALADLAWLARPVDEAAGERHSFFTYCVRVHGDGARDALAHHLYQRGIYTTLRYHPLHLSGMGTPGAALPVSEALSECALNLPLHPRLSDHDVATVIDAVHAFTPGASPP